MEQAWCNLCAVLVLCLLCVKCTPTTAKCFSYQNKKLIKKIQPKKKFNKKRKREEYLFYQILPLPPSTSSTPLPLQLLFSIPIIKKRLPKQKFKEGISVNLSDPCNDNNYSYSKKKKKSTTKK